VILSRINALIVRYDLWITFSLVVIVTTLSLIPLPALPEVPGKDKTHHILAYLAVAFPISWSRPKGFIWILVAILCWSGVLEWIQPYVNRHMNIWDFAANALGIFLGYIAGKLASGITAAKTNPTKKQ
jgi:VanZ family protein